MHEYHNTTNQELITAQSELAESVSLGQEAEVGGDVSTQSLVTDVAKTQMSDSDRQRSTVTDTKAGRDDKMSDSLGQLGTEVDSSIGHDRDLPERNDRHTLSTYEVGRLFEDSECRVSERTIIRWCNKNKHGVRRLDCAFDTNDRKYYISKESVAAVLKEEWQKGRQSELFNTSLSELEGMTDAGVGQQTENAVQRPTVTDINAGRDNKMSDTVGQGMTDATPTPDKKAWSDELEGLLEENRVLKVELTKKEEQGRTKDELMAFLRQEIDRRGDQINKDRETYENSLDWFRNQIKTKDAVIGRLNFEVRGLLGAPTNENSGADPVSQGQGGLSAGTPNKYQ